MARQLISSGSSFESDIGYSRAVRQDPWVFVSGTTGFDYTTMTIPDGLEAQTEQCMRNIVAALEAAQATLDDVVRVTYVIARTVAGDRAEGLATPFRRRTAVLPGVRRRRHARPGRRECLARRCATDPAR